KEGLDNKMLRLSGEGLAQLRVLRGNADRAGVEVAFPEHDAAHDNEGRRGETKFLCAEQAGNSHVPAGLELAIGLNNDPATEVVQHENLLSFGNAELPGQ